VFFSNTKKNKHTRKQTKKKQEKGRSSPSIFCSTFALLALASYLFVSNAFFDLFFFYSTKKKKKKRLQRKDGAFLQAPNLPSHFWFPLLPSHFCSFVSNALFSHLLLLKQKKKKENIEKKKNAKKGGTFL
jgi:hypothetical protein